MIHFLVWIVVSGIAGFVASKVINRSGSGLLMDIVLGIIGGFVGGFIVSHVPALGRLVGHSGMSGFIVEIIVAVAGAMLVIFIFNLLFRRRA
ncbi:MAG: GlsB/YeaQ/YmgE family stress response membrane protein [Caulobacterales bacterium]